jgi:glycerol-3-phosphate dehydrogenase (NAD(P)+)
MKIAILGAGAWGTALAVRASHGGTAHTVTLWARDTAHAQSMASNRVNQRYLPGLVFPDAMHIAKGGEAGLRNLLPDQDLIVLAAPMAGLRVLLERLRDQACPVAWLCKGLEAPPLDVGGLGRLGHEVQQSVAPALRAGVLSGPSFAQEVALGQPTALVAASQDPGVRDSLVQAFHGRSLRVYATDDVVGVEVGGAVKNVLAIATGLCDGLALGLNARAALITRGLAEMTRLGVALGARSQTFTGLSGLGDLVLTATGDLSRNRKVGLALARGASLEQAVAELGHVAEGVYCARTVLQRAEDLGVDMPVTRCVVALLDGQLQSAQALAELMGRDPKAEAPDLGAN